MDKYDRMLLAALLENGRASYAELARKVNLSAPAIFQQGGEEHAVIFVHDKA
ncbi:AsnC family protein, partial [Pseudomonas chlororaphis]|uniref:AsnC family protein n=1 Tax=Pseudomonas chlororaphis TaxID=587753 RepID=UPI001B3244A1